MPSRKLNLTADEIARPFAGRTGASNSPPILSPEQLAELLGLSVKTIYEWMSKGRLDGAYRKRGKHALFWRDRALRHPVQRQGVELMPDESDRVRVGDRVTIYPRGAKKTWVADFWQDGAHKKQSLKTSNKKVAIERATKLAADLIGGTYQAPPPAVTVQAGGRRLHHVPGDGGPGPEDGGEVPRRVRPVRRLPRPAPGDPARPR